MREIRPEGPALSRAALGLFIAALAIGIVAICGARGETGLIRILSIGESYYPETRVPFFFRADPRIRYQPVPTNWYEGTFQAVGSDIQDAQKFLRQYIPRSYERFHSESEVILLSDFEVDIIEPEHFIWMERSVREEGLGIGKYEMNYDPAHWRTFDLFRSSAVYPAFPASLAFGQEFRGDGIYAVSISGTGVPHPILRLPNMRNRRIPIDIGTGKAGFEQPRPGATVIARYVPNDEPAMIVWEYGEGRAMTCVPGHDTIVWGLSEHWPYVADFWINQAWYLAGLEIPLEIEMLHNLRESSMIYSTQRSLATSLIEFVEKFGASTSVLYDELASVDSAKREADGLYTESMYVESSQRMEFALDGIGRVAETAVEAKEAALFWIYLVEWAIVSATGALVGVLLWTLMVRRRLYAEVTVTRLK